MLATRIIPTLLVYNGKLVKGKQFKSHRTVGVPMQAMRIYANRGVDELLYLDIGATPQNKRPDFKFISAATDGCFFPVTVGGGITDVEDIHHLFNAGADKVVIGTSSLTSDIVYESSKKHGAQAIVVSVDYYNNDDEHWTENCARAMELFGCGELFLNSIDRDGMMEGYDLKTIERVSKAVSIPVIASGGCGIYEHMVEAVQAGASAVAASSMFLFTDSTPRGAAQYLHEKGIRVRL